jgi:hypothetical protein
MITTPTVSGEPGQAPTEYAAVGRAGANQAGVHAPAARDRASTHIPQLNELRA